jgi:hypothetical protein
VDIHPKDALDHVISEFDSLMRGKKPISSCIPCLRKDSTLFYADIGGSITIVKGRRCGVGFFGDVTAHKRAEEALRKKYLSRRVTL